MVDFLDDSVRDLAAMVRAREVSSRELVQHALERIDALDGRVNAFVAVDCARALAEAGVIDELVARGEEVGSLAGIPIGVKDLEDAEGFRTTRGSTLYADSAPATSDSALVARLRAAGCVVIGKTNTPELGHKADTTNLVVGATRNPWNLEHTSGGSSGGSSAALAAGMVPLCTGSDGGGSIRIPSALCGFSGLKPSLGRVPSGGRDAPDWQHLSSKGPMARRIGDVALALDAVIGPEPTDLRSLPMPEASWSSAVLDARPPLRVSWSPTLGYATPDAEVLAICERAVTALEDLGAEVVRVDAVFPEDPAMTWATLVGAYLLRSVRRAGVVDDDWSALDPTLRPLLALGASRTALDVVDAEDACHRYNLDLVAQLADTRVLLTPTTAATAPVSGRNGVVNGEETPAWVAYTYPFNLTRSPAGTVCAGVTAAGLPVGLQVIGPQHGDQVVLRTIAALEGALGLFDPPRL
jgi:Asp-tRNA(Asn)/Glu-tRNA(Gln) amidotransferase A subunit family amidase